MIDFDEFDKMMTGEIQKARRTIFGMFLAGVAFWVIVLAIVAFVIVKVCA